MHFGLEPYVPYVLYLVTTVSFVLTVFWRPIVGIFFLLPLIPLQTIRDGIKGFPLGASVIGVMLLGIALGLLRSGQPVLPKTPWTRLVFIYAGFTFVSLCLGSSYLNRPFPLPGESRFNAWQEYMVMPALLLLTAAVKPTKRHMQVMILMMCLATLRLDKSFWDTVSGRDFSSYSDDLHEESGSMGYAGANGLAAFCAQVTALLVALATFERRFWLRAGYYGLAVFSAVCLMYSFSRGGYAALLVGLLVLGLLKQRKLLVLLIIFLSTWTTVVPPAVRQRVEMTYDEQSASLDNTSKLRLSLWANAMEVFDANAMLGSGFDTSRYMQLNKGTGRAGVTDTHNYFIKVLVETGIVGLIIFLWLLARAFGEGYRLFRLAQDPFFASLGLGLIGWLVCTVVASLFGDHWTFLQSNGYMWVLGGLVSRAYALEQSKALTAADVQNSSEDSSDIPVAATVGQESNEWQGAAPSWADERP